nr:hypothetical protein Iba_chr07aCG8760 [Ipomoea batatas]
MDLWQQGPRRWFSEVVSAASCVSSGGRQCQKAALFGTGREMFNVLPGSNGPRQEDAGAASRDLFGGLGCHLEVVHMVRESQVAIVSWLWSMGELLQGNCFAELERDIGNGVVLLHLENRDPIQPPVVDGGEHRFVLRSSSASFQLRQVVAQRVDDGVRRRELPPEPRDNGVLREGIRHHRRRRLHYRRHHIRHQRHPVRLRYGASCRRHLQPKLSVYTIMN